MDMKHTVEEAARIEREKILQELKDGYRKHKDTSLYNAFAATIEKYAVPLFKDGAEWQSKQSPWISVKERLPEEGKPVLIRLKDGVIRLACYDIEEDSNIYFWNDNYAYETFRPWDVTHWREIPSFDEILEPTGMY